jgi:hypothetical protein
MTASERSKILKMIEDGKLTPEEGLRLMQALGDDPVEDKPSPPGEKIHFQTVGKDPTSEPDPSISRTVEKARSLWMIPLWIGVVITIFGGWVMYKNVLPESISAWFYCLGLPIFILGVLITILGWGSKTARWLFVSVKQKPGEFPKRILIGFPLPLGLTSWILRNFGHMIHGLGNVPVDELILAVQQSSEPLVVNVDEGEEGEKVQVFIG